MDLAVAWVIWAGKILGVGGGEGVDLRNKIETYQAHEEIFTRQTRCYVLIKVG